MQAYTRAIATLQGLEQKLGNEVIGSTFASIIRELEADWAARQQ